MYTPQRLTCNLFTQCYNLSMIFRDDPDVPERENPLYKGECVSVLTFIIGLVILIGGAALYGRFCEKVFGPDDRKTPAYTKEDGVDFVPMKGWKNSLINLLNIAGTGPILGPIQGILFGPIAFLTIPIGNIIGGAMHDYFSGMICLRDGGTQMPEMIRRYSTKGIYKFYNVFVCVLLLLVGAVFIYTPGDIAATQVFGFDGKATSVSTWSSTVSSSCTIWSPPCSPSTPSSARSTPSSAVSCCSPPSVYSSASSSPVCP